MPRKRANVVLPDDLIADVDALVGPRGRSAFLAEVVALSLLDTLIAATALEYGLTLITANRRHFPMPDLLLYPLAGENA